MVAAKVNEEPRFGQVCAIGFGLIASCLAILLLLRPFQVLTGDETRYLMYAYSIVRNGRFVMTLPEWRQLYLAVTGNQVSILPAADGAVLFNSVYLPTLLSPIAGLFTLWGLRAAAMLAGFVGLFYLLRLCRRFASPGTALLTVAVAGFSLPLLPYLHLFYMETFLFALVCCIWDRLQKSDRGTWGDLLTAILIVAMPFVHMRGSVVAAVFYAALLWQQYRRGNAAFVIVLVALAGVTFGALVGLNQAIYGGITGAVHSVHPPFPWQWFPVFAMQAFSVHHGLIAYAPLWLLGYAGLLGGAARRMPLAWQGLILAAVALVTGGGVDAGECWPARYWVMSIPMLGVGLSLLWQFGKPALLRAITVMLVAATFVNSIIFFLTPNALLENRQTTATYQQLFDRFGHFDFGLMLPMDAELPKFDDPADLEAAENLAIGAAMIVLSLALALAKQRSAYAAPALLLLLAALDLSRIDVVPPDEYAMTPRRDGFNVAFHAPLPAGYIQFGRYWEAWYVKPDWPRFAAVIAGTDDRRVREVFPANQVIPASCSAGMKSVTIDGPDGFDFSAQLQVRFIVYRSESLLINSFGWLRREC